MEIKRARILFTNIFYIRLKGTGILIDSGNHVSEKSFLKKIKDFGKIDYLILTHTHFDHAGNAVYLKRYGTKVVVHTLEKEWLKKGETPKPPGIDGIGKLAIRFSGLKSFKFPKTEPDIIVEESKKIHDLLVLHTPGHTPGSLSVIYDNIAFCGDLIMNLTFRPVSHIPIFAHDLNMVRESVNKLREMGVKIFFPAHGRPVTIDNLRI